MAVVPAAVGEDRARAAGPARLSGTPAGGPLPAGSFDPRVVEITDAGDPRLADYRDLTDVALRSRTEPPLGLFIAEGSLVIRRALAAGYPLRSAVVTPRWLASLRDDLSAAGAGGP